MEVSLSELLKEAAAVAGLDKAAAEEMDCESAGSVIGENPGRDMALDEGDGMATIGGTDAGEPVFAITLCPRCVAG